MSVFVLTPAEFGSIATTLQLTRNSFRNPIFPLSFAERWEYKALIEPMKKQNEDEYTTSLVEPFVYRLYIANAMSEQYTYWKDGKTAFTIPVIELPKGKVLSPLELLKTLRSLRYNIVTNGGNTFLGVKDDEKLNEVIDALKDHILHE
jgi:hypothetical protein